MNSLYKYFEDFSKLFYWLLILTSWLLTADIVGLFFIDKTYSEIFSDLKISEVLLIFMVQTTFILTSIIIYRVLQFIWILVPKNNKDSYNDYEISRNYYTPSELLNTAVKTNNPTMYSYVKDYKDDIKSDLNQKYLCFTVVLLLILDLCLENSILRDFIKNYNDFTVIKKMAIIIVIASVSLGLFVLFHGGNKSDYTNIRKEESLKK